MKLEVEIIKEIPEKKVKMYEDRVVYNTALLTREYTKGMGAYPYLTGDLQKAEAGSPITGRNAVYNLLAGVDYAKEVWNYKNPNWTNTKTVPQWYYNVYRKYQKKILHTAQQKAIKEIK